MIKDDSGHFAKNSGKKEALLEVHVEELTERMKQLQSELSGSQTREVLLHRTIDGYRSLNEKLQLDLTASENKNLNLSRSLKEKEEKIHMLLMEAEQYRTKWHRSLSGEEDRSVIRRENLSNQELQRDGIALHGAEQIRSLQLECTWLRAQLSENYCALRSK